MWRKPIIIHSSLNRGKIPNCYTIYQLFKLLSGGGGNQPFFNLIIIMSFSNVLTRVNAISLCLIYSGQFFDSVNMKDTTACATSVRSSQHIVTARGWGED